MRTLSHYENLLSNNPVFAWDLEGGNGNFQQFDGQMDTVKN